MRLNQTTGRVVGQGLFAALVISAALSGTQCAPSTERVSESARAGSPDQATGGRATSGDTGGIAAIPVTGGAPPTGGAPATGGSTPAETGGAATCVDVCGGICTNLLTDPLHCGACENADCTVLGLPCVDGVCQCAGDWHDCAGICANVMTDANNCSVCGKRCVGNLPVCRDGVCGPDCSKAAGPLVCNGTTCVDPVTDSNNCGGCGIRCTSPQVCVNGTCGCTTGRDCGPGICANFLTDADNCGACGNACTLPETCRSGVCSCGGTDWQPCGTGATGVCANLQIDVNNCGTCGNKCTSPQTCAAGVCSCGAGYTFCGSSCVLLNSDRSNCGACGNVCPGTLPDGGVTGTAQSCQSGKCACQAGLSLCGSECVNLQFNNANCGTCGNACPAGTTGIVCQSGVCQ